MICNCAEHIRMRRDDRVKHIQCFMNSRRLPEATDEIQSQITTSRTNARNLKPEDCEGMWH